MQPVGGMSEKVAMLMNGAALDQDVVPERGKSFFEPWRAVDNGEFRHPQTAICEIVEKRTPSGFASELVEERRPYS